MTSLESSVSLLDACPGCGAGMLYTVSDGQTTNFLCRICSRCWHVELGGVRRVEPATCPGCEWRGTCQSRWDPVTHADASREPPHPEMYIG